MKLTYLYVSVPELAPALAFYRDQLGLDEAWREGESTVAFALPGTDVQLMLDVPVDADERWQSGPFYEVDDVRAFMKERSELRWLGEAIDMPGGQTATFADPAGNVMHVFDQSAAE
ncbi:VOC family protein [Jiangella gansuensis]|uniref:VOC family protein n=1 Tax=Jiangella gansuensis TaxID=281473 RepID=UPI00047DB5BB|nr:VOC family protein [Jiangella gansuensis]